MLFTSQKSADLFRRTLTQRSAFAAAADAFGPLAHVVSGFLGDEDGFTRANFGAEAMVALAFGFGHHFDADFATGGDRRNRVEQDLARQHLAGMSLNSTRFDAVAELGDRSDASGFTTASVFDQDFVSHFGADGRRCGRILNRHYEVRDRFDSGV